jgi:RNA polymerase sigma-70 factor (ECF subfamily)
VQPRLPSVASCPILVSQEAISLGMTPEEYQRFLAGDPELFAAVVDHHSPRLARFASRYGRATHDLEDLLQETWIAAFERRTSFQNRGSFEGWLLRVCRTVCADRVRRRTREAMGLAELTRAAPERDDGHEVMGDALRRQELGDLATDYVMRLPPKQRLIVISRLVFGRTTSETARLMGCAEGTVKATLRQALLKLRSSAADCRALLEGSDDRTSQPDAAPPAALSRHPRGWGADQDRAASTPAPD